MKSEQEIRNKINILIETMELRKKNMDMDNRYIYSDAMKTQSLQLNQIAHLCWVLEIEIPDEAIHAFNCHI